MARERQEKDTAMRFRIRHDANFSNLVEDRQWFQSGVVYEGTHVPMTDRVVRVFPPEGHGTPVDVPDSLLERVE
jgi:hypothetical protein